MESLSCHLTQNTSLKKLDVSCSGAVISSRAVAEAIRQSGVEELNLSLCDLNVDFIATLSVHMKTTTNLKKLDVCGNIAIGSIPTFAEALFHSTLEEVNLRSCCLTEEFIATFLACTKENNKRFKVAEWDTIEVEAQHEQLRKPPFARKFRCVKMFDNVIIEKHREQLEKLAFVSLNEFYDTTRILW